MYWSVSVCQCVLVSQSVGQCVMECMCGSTVSVPVCIGQSVCFLVFLLLSVCVGELYLCVPVCMGQSLSASVCWSVSVCQCVLVSQSVCWSMCCGVCLWVNCISVCLSIFVLFNLYVTSVGQSHLFVGQFVDWSVYVGLSVGPPVAQCVRWTTVLFIGLPVLCSVCMLISLFVGQFLC